MKKTLFQGCAYRKVRYMSTHVRRLLAVALLISIAGCAREPRRAGVLRLAAAGDASTLDPARAYDSTSIQYVRVLYRGLVDYDDRANLFDEVAKSHWVSRDGKTYRFVLRPDVHFHSGRRVVAEDFRYAIERVLDPKTQSDGLSIFNIIEGAEEFSERKKTRNAEGNGEGLHTMVGHVSGIEVKGDDEITFRLKHADATFLNYLALPFAYAVPREHVEKLEKQGKSLSENPDGCGPFKLDEWVHDGWIKLKRNPNYFHRDLPRAERIEVQMGVSPTLQTMLFEQGRTDVLSMSDVPAPEFIRFSHDAKWKPLMLHGPMMDVRYVCLNTEMKPFDNVLVRRAMNYAIDRRRVASFLSGRATVARGALPPQMPGFDPRLYQYGYDPAKARQLLKQAGYAAGFGRPITLWYSTNEPWYAQAAQSIQGNLKDVGIAIALKPVRYPELKIKAGQRQSLEMSMMGWIQDFPDPSNFLDVLFNGEKITPTASNNRAFYNNPQVNKILGKAIEEVDRARRLKMYQEAEAIIVQDAPWVFLHHTERFVLRQSWISGYSLHPMWSERFEYVKVAGN